MRVLYLIDSLHDGGAETSLVDMLPALINRGVEPTVVALLPDDGRLERKLADMSVNVTRVRFGARAIGAVRSHLTSNRAELLHTTLLRADIVGRPAARLANVPVVTTLANDSYGRAHRCNSRYGRWAVDAVHAADLSTAWMTSRFHAISLHLADTMARRLMIPRDRVEVVYRGRDQHRLGRQTSARRDAARRMLGVSSRAFLILCVGRLDRQKGHETSIKAFAASTDIMPASMLMIAGRPGNAAENISALAARTPNVRLLGDRSDVAELMCAADLLIFPSRWEGLGGTVIEAMALELPTIISDIPALREVTGGCEVSKVPVDDVQALTGAIRDARSRNLTLTAARARQRFETLFTIDVCADRMSDLYRQARQRHAV